MIVFPARKKSCWECVWRRDLSSEEGVTSWCGQFEEEIHYEGIADTCDAWEELCTP